MCDFKDQSMGHSNRHLQERIDFKDHEICLLNKNFILFSAETSEEEHKGGINSFVSHDINICGSA